MRTKALFAIAVVVGLLGALPGPVGAAPKKKKSGPVVVGKDAADDWGANVDPNIAPAGNALGQELVEASIGMADAKTVNFVIKLNSLPPTGGVPESSRYNWDFAIDADAFQLSGARTEFVRGICNPLITDPMCPPAFGDPAALADGPFFLRQGSCLVGEDCAVVAVINATFDAGAATITIPVPLATLKGKPGSKITPLPSSFGDSIYAAPALLVSSTAAPADTMPVTGTFVVPRGKK